MSESEDNDDGQSKLVMVGLTIVAVIALGMIAFGVLLGAGVG